MSIKELCERSSLELLAPAGRMESLHAAVEAGCDAVYLGGKAFNMRMLRSSFNFSNEELVAARQYTASHGVKMYVTVNNLYTDDSLGQLRDYLLFMQNLGIDALIVQDMAVVKIHQDLNLQVPLHASVQMGANNLETVLLLEELGFERVILSKNLSLEEIKHISSNSRLGIEYFVHGDVCVSHTGQCYMGSFVFGESGNKGRCLKPCRWPFLLETVDSDRPGSLQPQRETFTEQAQYCLAHNDLCLYEHLEELVDAGVSSFKIEGRMREPDYVSFLVSTYRRGLDRIICGNRQVPIRPEEDMENLQAKRVRNFTTGCLYGVQAADSIGDGSREPRFFSKARQLPVLQPDDYIAENGEVVSAEMEMQVKVRDLESLAAALGAGAGQLIIEFGPGFREIPPWTAGEIIKAGQACRVNHARLILELPRLGHRLDFSALDEIRKVLEPAGIAGLIVHDPGIFHHVKNWGVNVQGGFGLNIANSSAADFWTGSGMQALELSLELKMPEINFAQKFNCGLAVQGPVCGMITDITLFPDAGEANAVADGGTRHHLVDELGQAYPVYTDVFNRSFIFYPYDLCLFPWLPRMAAAGIKFIRINGEHWSVPMVGTVVGIYRDALGDLKNGRFEQRAAFAKLLGTGSRMQSAASFGQENESSTEEEG